MSNSLGVEPGHCTEMSASDQKKKKKKKLFPLQSRDVIKH